MHSNYVKLVQGLALEIATDGKPIEARQMASLYLKNTLNANSASQQREMHERWKALESTVRSAVKEALLRALCSNEAGVPRFAAIAASEVACVELPFQEWSQFVPALTKAISDPAEEVKLAAVHCLGSTWERMIELQGMPTHQRPPVLVADTVNAMLNAIVQGEPFRRPASRGVGCAQ